MVEGHLDPLLSAVERFSRRVRLAQALSFPGDGDPCRHRNAREMARGRPGGGQRP